MPKSASDSRWHSGLALGLLLAPALLWLGALIILPHADLADRASTEAERQLELRTRDRQRKLIAKIDAALRRIEDGSYGFCEETGEPIGIPRLIARPTATLSLEAQESRELRQKLFGD